MIESAARDFACVVPARLTAACASCDAFLFRALGAVVLVQVLSANCASAQDARSILRAADDEMGASRVESILYSGAGYAAAVGQNYSSSLESLWPYFNLQSYTRVIDYRSDSSREERILTQGQFPVRGGGRRPFAGERRIVDMVRGDTAWGINLQGAIEPQPGEAEQRRIELIMTPHGFIKAALDADDLTAATRTESGRTTRQSTVVSFTALGRYRINGWINADNLVTNVQTWFASAVLGDMYVEVRFQNYQDYDGIKFPSVIHQSIGDPTNPGYHVEISDVQINVSNAELDVPREARQAVQSAAVRSQELAPGVWMVTGGYNALLVEFENEIAVVEAGQSEQRSLDVMAEARRLIPGKPIRYVVNTHHHFDHASGLRAYAAEDVLVVTHASNFEYYEGIVFNAEQPRIRPDRFSMAPRQAHFMLVDRTREISDGNRVLQIHHVQDLDHSEDMLIAYLPEERLLVEADMFQRPAENSPPSEGMLTLLFNLERLRLEPEWIVSVHGGLIPIADFLESVGQDRIVQRGGGFHESLNP